MTYNASALADYLRATGNWTDPVTRTPILEAELRHLDKLVPGTPTLLGMHSGEGLAARKDSADRQSMLEGLDRMTGDIVATIVRTVETESGEPGQLRLVQNISEFEHLFAQLRMSDAELARQCCSQYLALLRGPPNRPVQYKDAALAKLAERTLVENLERCNVRERANLLPPHSPMPDPRGRIRELMW